MITRNKPFEEIYDLFAIRIILHTQDKTQCYYVMGIINQLFVPDRFKSVNSVRFLIGLKSVTFVLERLSDFKL